MNAPRAEMDATDKAVLNMIQSEFPLSARPYRDMAGRLNLTEDETFDRVESLRARGIIRRLGGVFDSGRLGYVSTLAAMKVPADRIDQVADVIGSYPGVTHNYLREDVYNVWFTLICHGKEELDRTIDEMKERSGISDVLVLPATTMFKIRAVFKLDDERTDGGT